MCLIGIFSAAIGRTTVVHRRSAIRSSQVGHRVNAGTDLTKEEDSQSNDLLRKVLKMNARSFLIAICSVLLLSATAPAALYVEQFDSDRAGWLESRISGGITNPVATWASSGGNLDGHLTASVTTSGPRIYGFQPTDLTPYGDLTGLTLTTDFMLDGGTVTGPVGHKVRFYVGTYTGGYNYFVTDAAFSWDPNADSTWTTHQVAMLAQNFILWPNQNAGTKTFAQVIANPEDIGLVFANGFTSNSTLGFSGTGTIHMDNFGTVPTVPEPASLIIWGLGGLGMAFGACRRRWKK